MARCLVEVRDRTSKQLPLSSWEHDGARRRRCRILSNRSRSTTNMALRDILVSHLGRIGLHGLPALRRPSMPPPAPPPRSFLVHPDASSHPVDERRRYGTAKSNRYSDSKTKPSETGRKRPKEPWRGHCLLSCTIRRMVPRKKRA